MANADSVADYKAVSMNVMHASIKTTDEIYSNHNRDEVQKRINSMGGKTKSEIQNDYEMFQKFLDWQRSEKINSPE